MGYRDFYDKDLDFFIEKYKNYSDNPRIVMGYAKGDLRMYANLYNRELRKKIINENSRCNYCNSSDNLSIDHIIPISKGGKNSLDNIQILCNPCNNKKIDK